MEYFLETTDTIEAGVGFDHYGLLHIVWLVLAALTFVFVTKAYCRKDVQTKAKWRKVVALLIVADELWKMLWLTIGGNYTFDYLPLHLCSINIILIAIHAWKPSKLLDNFLYLVCIPGALSALLFPSWASLPLANFMHLHSFTIHMLLAAYPIILTCGGDIKPDVKQLPKCLLLLAAMAVPLYFFNFWADTNFMFLKFAEAGTPLVWFAEHWGNHLLGFPVLIGAAIAIMHLPPLLLRRLRNNTKATA